MISVRTSCLVLMALCCVSAPQDLRAADPVPKTCDAKFHNLVRSRAWMEAQREVEVAETLILKPDSVLDYSCFSDLSNDAKGINIFQEDLSGHVDSVLSAMSVSCQTMADITKTMRCTDADKDKIFPTLQELVDNDIRPSCSDSTRDQNWKDADKVVFAELPRPLDKGGMDPIVADTDKLQGGNCGNNTYVFKTGVEYKYTEVTYSGMEFGGEEQSKKAGYCLAPGCVFNGNSCVSSL